MRRASLVIKTFKSARMTEPTKIEADDTGLPDQPPKPQDNEMSSVQPSQPPQTAADSDKYHKLKSRFQALKKVSH